MVLNFRKRVSIKAIFLGAIISTFLLLLIPTIAFLTSYESFDSDGPIKGLATLIMVSPIFLLFKLLYFSALSLLQLKKLFNALLISCLVAFSISIWFYWPLTKELQFLYTFLILAFSLNVGTIVWYKKHLTRN